MSGTTVLPPTNSFSWPIRIKGTVPPYALTRPDGTPAASIQAQPNDVVTWGNESNATVQVWNAIINGGTVSCAVGPNAILVQATNSAGVRTTVPCPIVTITVTGGRPSALASAGTITDPMAPGQSSTPAFSVPVNAGNLQGIDPKSTLIGGGVTLPAGMPVKGVIGTNAATIILQAPLTIPGTVANGVTQVGTTMINMLNSLVVQMQAPLPYLCMQGTSTVASGTIVTVPAFIS